MRASTCRRSWPSKFRNSSSESAAKLVGGMGGGAIKGMGNGMGNACAGKPKGAANAAGGGGGTTPKTYKTTSKYLLFCSVNIPKFEVNKSTFTVFYNKTTISCVTTEQDTNYNFSKFAQNYIFNLNAENE